MKIKFLFVLLLFFTKSVFGQGCWKEVSIGSFHTLALKKDGTLWAWGNTLDAIGNGTQTKTPTPVQIGSDTNWISVSAGHSHSLGLKKDGTLWAWGNSINGALGIGGFNVTIKTPSLVDSFNKYIYICAGLESTYAIKNDNTLWACGRNDLGHLGDGTYYSKAKLIQIGNDKDWNIVSTTSSATIGIKNNGELWSWGQNLYGILANGTIQSSTVPLRVDSNKIWRFIHAGSFHALGIKKDGTLWAWGNNGSGQIGDGLKINITIPKLINSDTTWLAAAAGSNYSLAVKKDGFLWCWGANDSGQLGNGTFTGNVNPSKINNATGFSKLAANRLISIGIKTDNTIYSWGSNVSNLIGNGIPGLQNKPIEITNCIYYEPFKLNFINAIQNQNKAEISWSTNLENTTLDFNILRGINDSNFVNIGTVNSKCCYYNFVDNVLNDNAFYKLEIINKNGTKFFSQSTKLVLNTNQQTRSIFPNPLRPNFSIESKNIKEIVIVNFYGRIVFKSIVNSSSLIINTNSWPKGMYIAKVSMNTGEVKIEKIIVQ